VSADGSEAALTTGYTPFLAFTVPDLQAAVQRLIPMGAEMDGPVQFGSSGRVAALRNPDGHMMTLLERS
jgi:predicted enzyme related to lactoylglutathione lyase